MGEVLPSTGEIPCEMIVGCETVTYVVEYKEKYGNVDRMNSVVEFYDGDYYKFSFLSFGSEKRGKEWIKKRKQQAIDGEDYPIKDIKLFRVTKEEIR